MFVRAESRATTILAVDTNSSTLQLINSSAQVIILVADGLTIGGLEDAINDGDVPELAPLRDTSGLQVITTVFPSVTGVAYIPMLTGRHPADAGVPGLRWFDRSRRIPAIIGHARSYVGPQFRQINDDLARSTMTAFELAKGDALGSSAMVTRGLPVRRRLDRGIVNTARALMAHVRGDVAAWAALEEEVAEELVSRIRREGPRFVFAAFTAGDKAAHAAGLQSSGVRRSLKLVDDVVGSIRRNAERDGRWRTMQLWVVSDHGHSPVNGHFDLAEAIRDQGIRVRAHPWTLPDRSECAVMVSGNSMAHIYLGLDSGTAQTWSALQDRWTSTFETLSKTPAIDLMTRRLSSTTLCVSRDQESAEISIEGGRFSYRTLTGNPLGIEPFERMCEDAAHERAIGSPYPDGIVQLARLVLAERAGDVVISAAPHWDLRRRYEPIEHVSSHGALHAEHMLVPLVGNRRLDETPRRTAGLYGLCVIWWKRA